MGRGAVRRTSGAAVSRCRCGVGPPGREAALVRNPDAHGSGTSSGLAGSTSWVEPARCSAPGSRGRRPEARRAGGRRLHTGLQRRLAVAVSSAARLLTGAGNLAIRRGRRTSYLNTKAEMATKTMRYATNGRFAAANGRQQWTTSHVCQRATAPLRPLPKKRLVRSRTRPSAGRSASGYGSRQPGLFAAGVRHDPDVSISRLPLSGCGQPPHCRDTVAAMAGSQEDLRRKSEGSCRPVRSSPTALRGSRRHPVGPPVREPLFHLARRAGHDGVVLGVLA